MMNLRPFQIVLIGVFILLAVGGLVAISLFKGNDEIDQNNFGGSVTIWGTFDDAVFTKLIGDISSEIKGFGVVRYVEKDARTFEPDLLNAIAEGNSPDLVILPHDLLVKHRTKLSPISFEVFPVRMFRDLYVDGAEIFMRSDGVYGLPFAVDPIVMYWNRDIFSSSGLAAPPRTWEEVLSVTTPAITRTNADFDITRSALAFGEYGNIRNAKDILSMLFLQSGTSIVEERDAQYLITISDGGQNEVPPAAAALTFYTQFALPSNLNYSWNRALPLDALQFLGGELGIYFGLGSEYRDIARQNPNLNFDIAEVPQGAGATIRRDFGRFYAFTIPRASQNPNGAYAAARVLSAPNISTSLATSISMAPVQRSEVAKGSSNPYEQVLYQSALIARGWLDPDPSASENVFKSMIEDVTSGRNRPMNAISDASQRLRSLFK